MQQRYYWKANSLSASQEISCFLRELNVHYRLKKSCATSATSLGKALLLEPNFGCLFTAYRYKDER